MINDRASLIQEVLKHYDDIARSMHRAAMPLWLELDLSMTQVKALFVLSCLGPIPISAVANALEVGLPAASHLVERLVKADLVSRAEDPTDRRRTLASLTSAGEELIAVLRQDGLSALCHWLEALDDDELTAVHHGFRILICAARQHS